MFDENLKSESVSHNTPQVIIDATILKVSKILDEFYPNHLVFGDGSFAISRGSTQVLIIVRPFTNDDCAVECIASVVTGAKISDELMRFLLRKNSELHIGAFGLMFDDTITYTHSISGDSVNSGELKVTLDSVSIISDYYDDIIVDLAGGKRAKDILEDMELI